MKTLITYGSQYGSAEHYARKFAALTGLPVLPYSEVRNAAYYDRVIHFGALYAGGVLGLRQVAAQLSARAELVIATVGLADVQDAENIRNIRQAIRSQISADVLGRTQIFHLRGAIDYSRLKRGHRIMMALLYARARGLPAEKRSAEVRAMIESYGKRVSFVDDAALIGLRDRLCAHKGGNGHEIPVG